MSDTPSDRTPEEITATVAKLEAEAAKAHAEAAKAHAEAEKADLERRLSLLEVTLKERARAEADAADVHHYVYRFTGGVDKLTVTAAMAQLTAWHRQAPEGTPFEIVFFSPGGDVISGFALFDHLRWLSSLGHPIITGATGMAASMGGVLIQAGDTRWMSSEAWYMIHRAAFGAAGKTFEIEDEVEWVKRIEQRICDIFVRRSNGKLTAAKIKRNWDRKDWWITSNEALELGLIDSVRGPS